MADQSTFRPANDAYTGMLAISLLALLVGIGLLYYDVYQFPEAAPKSPPKKAQDPLPKTPPPEVKEAEPAEPKAGEPKAGEPKAGEPKAGEPKAGEPKAPEAKGDPN